MRRLLREILAELTLSHVVGSYEAFAVPLVGVSG